MQIFAHRGASGTEPENTFTAFQRALEMQVDAIELDVHLADGELVVIHDRYVDNTTNGIGKVSDMSLAQLTALDAGQGQSIPTLWQVLVQVSGRCELHIELKSDGCIERLLTLIDRAQQQLAFSREQFLISSFNHYWLYQIKFHRPDWRIAPLIACCPLALAQLAESLNAFSLNVCVDVVNQALIDDAHQRGLKLYVYTVNQAEDMRVLQQMGVDGIYTNYPERAQLQLNQPDKKEAQ